MTIRCLLARLSWLLLVTVFCPALADEGRFLRLDTRGQPLTTGSQDWPCVLDRSTGLIWEVKTAQPGLHQRDRTFAWQAHAPMGTPPPHKTTHCATPPCTTAALVLAVNRQGWCGSHDWRLPEREELRSLVDYRRPYPGPVLDTDYFPRTVSQFYWSASPNASDAREAWGIGFAFGFDYAYPKRNRVHVRLVRDGSAP